MSDSIAALMLAAATASGRPALSDQLAADLAEGTGVSAPVHDARGGLAGFAQVSPRPGGATMQVVLDPAAAESSPEIDTFDLALRAATAGLHAAAAAGMSGDIDWWITTPDDQYDRAATAAGFAPVRSLHQLRIALPASRRAAVTTRAFRPGVDDDDWLAVNNRAFAGHAEQGGWTPDTLEQRMRQPWFDADGFRLHEVGGRLAAFCWTKLHHDEPGLPSVAGEIYVIGVDPDFQGRGLGRELTLAGLDAITDRGVTDGLLYVDAANHAAVSLYRSLGFTIAHTERAYSRPLPPPSAE